MEGKEIILLGFGYSIFTGFMEFILKKPLNAFGLSLGMILGGILIILFERIIKRT